MPMYTYECEDCGNFESYYSITTRDEAFCECGKKATRVPSTNEFAAKTRYILPPPAKRPLGEKEKIPHLRKKWV